MLRIILIVVILIAAGVGGFFAWAARYPALDPVATPGAGSFDPTLVEKGELLASLGYCTVCHTRPGGQPLAGGLRLPTPFGEIASTNITPDRETGIGVWSEEAFTRAMQQGVDRGGRHLYPVFPYDHFTRVAPEDIKAIYAYLMTQKPVVSAAPENTLRFPFNLRPLLAGWKLLFFTPGPLKEDPSRDAAWNRGAYLAEGLGHCGSCHTPRNALGGLLADRKFGGGNVEGWHSPALNAQSPAPVPWTKDALLDYLIKGWSQDHGVAAGPMTPVVDLLGDQSDEDLDALATYILSFANGAAPAAESALAFAKERESVDTSERLSDPAMQAGRAIFTQSCTTCHRRGQPAAPLALTSSLNGPDPRNAIRIIRSGIRPPKGARDHAMPPFAWISEKDMVNLLTFLRVHFSRDPAWKDLDQAVREVYAESRH